MDEGNSSVHRRLAATEKALGPAYRTDRLLYAKLFNLHNRLEQQARQVDADACLTREAVAAVREMFGATRLAA
jgi:hypothetical protein